MSNLIVWRPAVDSVYCFDALDFLGQMETGSVNCIVTSPPYFGLRDYGTASWQGGDSACDHQIYLGGNGDKSTKQVSSGGTQVYQARGVCPKCGAKRIDNQIGLEDTPQAFVDRLVDVFREARRVLRDDGTLWLNLGDSYASGEVGRHDQKSGAYLTRPDGRGIQKGKGEARQQVKMATGLPSKNLLGIPWRVAFALQADGWYLRQDNILAKRNPMPESVQDRTTRAHEYMFQLTKSATYWYDAEAVKEPNSEATLKRHASGPRQSFADTPKLKANPLRKDSGGAYTTTDGRNKRSVWWVTSEPYRDAHFATFGPSWIEPCILAGCPKDGLVLDPFMGAGTTALVAKQHGRHYIGCDLNPAYVEMATLRVEGSGIDRLNAKEPAPIEELPMFASTEGLTA